MNNNRDFVEFMRARLKELGHPEDSEFSQGAMLSAIRSYFEMQSSKAVANRLKSMVEMGLVVSTSGGFRLFEADGGKKKGIYMT